MPKYKPETEKAKTKNLIKSYCRSGFNQTRLAKQEGVAASAINQRLNRPIVQKTFAEYLKKDFNRPYLRKKLKEGLEANKVVGYLNNKINGMQKVSDEFVEIPDMYCRHKYLVTVLACLGYLKYDENGKTNISLTINNIKQVIENANRDNRDAESSSSSGDVEK